MEKSLVSSMVAVVILCQFLSVPSVFGVGIRLGPRHLLTHWSAVDAAYRHYRSSSSASFSAPSTPTSGIAESEDESSSTDWEILQSVLQSHLRVSFGEVGGHGGVGKGGQGGAGAAARKLPEKELVGIAGIVAWDVTFTLK